MRLMRHQIQGIRIRECMKTIAKCSTYAMYDMQSQAVTPAVDEVGAGLSVEGTISLEVTTLFGICVDSSAAFAPVDSLCDCGSTAGVESRGPSYGRFHWIPLYGRSCV